MTLRFVLMWMLAAALTVADSPARKVHATADSRADGRGRDLAQLNQAMRAWLEHVRADRLFIVVEQDSGWVQLRHGGAVLRDCAMVKDNSVAGQPLTGALAVHARRFRPSAPWRQPVSGPFDWEDVLATAASSSDALYFDNGLVLFASSHWLDLAPPAVQLHPHDLQALAGACTRGTPVVILPRRWQEISHEP